MHKLGMYYMSMYVVTSNILTNSTRQTTYNVEFLYEIYFQIRLLKSEQVHFHESPIYFIST